MPSRLKELLRLEIGELRPALHFVQGVTNLLLPQFCLTRLRTALWRAVKLEIGQGSIVMGDLFLSGSGDWRSLLTIGSYTYISGPLRINLGGRVQIGNSVNIGHDCLILTVDHEIAGSSRRAGAAIHRSVIIEDGVWIASRAIVMPGTRIGAGAIVAAGAVVTDDVPPHTLVGGVPARILRELDKPETH